VRATCSSSVDYYTTSIQNTITPNFDGKNDKIDFSQIVKFDKFEGAIFDKMGVIIFRPSIQTPTWDGTYIGRPLPTDTYWYKFSWLDSITKKPVLSSGWIVVKNR
jgi:gliding motility-associated-like protein